MNVFQLELETGSLEIRYDTEEQLKHFLENLLETFDKMKAHKAYRCPGSYDVRIPHSMNHILSGHIFITMVNDIKTGDIPRYAFCIRYKTKTITTASYLRTDESQHRVIESIRSKINELI